MVNPLLLPEIREMFAENDEEGLHALVTELNATSVAEFAEGLTTEEVWLLLSHAPIHEQATIFSFFPAEKQIELVNGVGRERMSKMLEAMSPDDRVDLLKLLPDDTVESLLPLVARADREDIRRLLSYPERSAGSVMTTDYASLPAEITVADALNRLRGQAPDRETIYYVYVIDIERRLIGFVSLRDLILAKPTSTIRQIMRDEVVSVRADQDREEVARVMARFDFLAIPVVDDQHRLLGIVTHDDVIDVLVEAATEDALAMGAVQPLEENYLETPFHLVWRSRVLWLSMLFIAQLLTYNAMMSFDDQIKQVVILSAFVPLCISTGGNSGSQAATLITRAMTLGHITPLEWWRVLRHEIAMGLALGAPLGLIGFLRTLMVSADDLGKVSRIMLSITIGATVAVMCVWGTLVGSMLPLMFRRLGFDPAYASTPFVATFVDVTGIVVLFTFATFFIL